MTKTKIQELQPGSICYTTGAFVEWTGTQWILKSINEDTYYDGHYVNGPGEDTNGVKHDVPFIEIEETDNVNEI